MEAIAKQLSDPGWWFTTVIVGLLISLFATYIRDALSLFGSRLFDRVAKARTRRTEAEEEKIRILLADPTMLILEQVRETSLFIAYLGCTGLLIAFPFLISLLDKMPELTQFDPVEWHVFRPYSFLGLPILVLSTMISGYWAISAARTMNKARRRYIETVKKRTAPNTSLQARLP